MLLEARGEDSRGNGHEHPSAGPRGLPGKVNAAVKVRQRSPFQWLASGSVGGFAVWATRLRGGSAPYVTAGGSLPVIVYRGVVEYQAGGEVGTIVGSQMMVVPGNTPLTIGSEHGATVIALARQGVALPDAASAGPAPQDGPHPGAGVPGE
jgi:hypothetical protein